MEIPQSRKKSRLQLSLTVFYFPSNEFCWNENFFFNEILCCFSQCLRGIFSEGKWIETKQIIHSHTTSNSQCIIVWLHSYSGSLLHLQDAHQTQCLKKASVEHAFGRPHKFQLLMSCDFRLSIIQSSKPIKNNWIQ